MEWELEFGVGVGSGLFFLGVWVVLISLVNRESELKFFWASRSQAEIKSRGK